MASEDRIKQLYQEQLGRPANPTQSLADSGVSSVDAVAFIKVVGDEFNVDPCRRSREVQQPR